MTLEDSVLRSNQTSGRLLRLQNPSRWRVQTPEKLRLKPTKENRKKFDIDLAPTVTYRPHHRYAPEQKIEVKTERDMWSRTSNIIAIEYESYGKPSGVNATEADFWFHNAIKDDVYCTLVFSVENLKKIVHGLDYHKSVSNGINNFPYVSCKSIQAVFYRYAKTFYETYPLWYEVHT